MGYKRMNSNLINIDGAKLKEALRQKNKKVTEASIMLGYSKSFLGRCIQRNSINKPALALLNQVCGIDPDSIMPDQEAEPVIEAAEQIGLLEAAPALDYDKLYDVIKSAIVDAWQDVNG